MRAVYLFQVLIYSLDGRELSSYSAYEWALGVKSVTWSPSSQFLAIGSYDEKVRLLNYVTWKTITVLNHPLSVDAPAVAIYQVCLLGGTSGYNIYRYLTV